MTKTLIELQHLSKRFVRGLDFAERLANRLGARIQEQTVHAVDRVNLSVKEKEVVGS